MNNGLPASERVEQATLRALHEVATLETRTVLGLQLDEIDGTLVSITSHDPGIVLNRALGLGLVQEAGEQTVERIRDRYRAAGVGRFFLHLAPDAQPSNLRSLLADAGMRPHRRWMKFKRGTEPPPHSESTLRVREIGARHVRDFGRIAAAAFGMVPAAADLFPGLVDRAGFHLYMTFDGDTPAGTGLLYIDGGDAWFDWGATDPDFRGRGSQRALITRRIADALVAGCTRLITCTGEAVPGDPQHSYHNIEWAGFRPDYLRENWIPHDESAD